MARRLQDLAANPAARREMGLAAWERARKRFTIELEIRQLQNPVLKAAQVPLPQSDDTVKDSR
jgi:hypothetical protein